jgi:hypothetical protein
MEENAEQIINLLLYNDDLREEIIYWLNDNGYLNDYKFNQYDEENEY